LESPSQERFQERKVQILQGKFQCRKKIPKVQMGIWPKEIELNRKEEEKV
jgi:hypothetical protein